MRTLEWLSAVTGWLKVSSGHSSLVGDARERAVRVHREGVADDLEHRARRSRSRSRRRTRRGRCRAAAASSRIATALFSPWAKNSISPVNLPSSSIGRRRGDGPGDAEQLGEGLDDLGRARSRRGRPRRPGRGGGRSARGPRRRCRGSMTSLRVSRTSWRTSSRSQPRVILRTASRTCSRRWSSAPKRWNQSWPIPARTSVRRCSRPRAWSSGPSATSDDLAMTVLSRSKKAARTPQC